MRVKRLLDRPALSTADRLSLYASTIASQWIIVLIVGWRAFANAFGRDELGMVVFSPLRTILTTLPSRNSQRIIAFPLPIKLRFSPQRWPLPVRVNGSKGTELIKRLFRP